MQLTTRVSERSATQSGWIYIGRCRRVVVVVSAHNAGRSKSAGIEMMQAGRARERGIDQSGRAGVSFMVAPAIASEQQTGKADKEKATQRGKRDGAVRLAGSAPAR